MIWLHISIFLDLRQQQREAAQKSVTKYSWILSPIVNFNFFRSGYDGSFFPLGLKNDVLLLLIL